MAGGHVSSGPAVNYPGTLTIYVFLTCLSAACGGLIFGYDIGISGGVTSMDTFLKRFFPAVYRKEANLVQSKNQYCKFNDNTLTLFTSSLYLAAMLAALAASTFTRKFGRKMSMLLGGALFLAGAAVNGFAQNVAMLIIGRVLLGFGIGFANQSAPVYLSEIPPYKYRGACNMLFQLSITIGILVANVLNYFTAKIQGDLGWRISLGCAGVPAIIFLLCTLWLPDTPNSLIERGKKDEAKSKLMQIRGTTDVEAEFNDMLAASEESKKVENPWSTFRKRKYRPHLTLVFLIPMFQQLTGMNVIMFYAPVLFKTIGMANSALMATVITGIVNMLATFVSIATVDRIGRKALFLEGAFQMFVCQIIIAIFVGVKFGVNGDPGVLPKWYAVVVVLFICIYVAGFAWSWGPLGWLVPCEILPLEIRSAGQTLNVLVNMFFTFIIAESFTGLMCVARFGLFIFFAFFVVAMFFFIVFFFPETKGLPIEDMQHIFKKHKYWKKYYDGGDEPPSKPVQDPGVC